MRLGATKSSAGLRTVYIELNNACNYACTYCYLGSKKIKFRQEVQSINEINNLLNWANCNNIGEVIFLGGEPMLYAQFKEAVELVNRYSFSSAGVVTNGSLLTPYFSELLNNNGFWVNLSMRGGTQVTFNQNARRKAAWVQFLRAMTTATAVGLRLGVEYDVLFNNYKEVLTAIEKCLEICPNLEQFQLHRIAPFGDASDWTEPQMLKIDHWHEVLAQIAEAHVKYGLNIFVEDGLPLCGIDQKYWKFLRPCSCGRTSITVDTTGNARSCSCNATWKLQEFQHGANSQVLLDIEAERRKILDASVCSSCALRERCWGGCPNSTHSLSEAYSSSIKPFVSVAQ